MTEFILQVVQFAFTIAFAIGAIALCCAGIFASCMVIYSVGGALIEAAKGRK